MYVFPWATCFAWPPIVAAESFAAVVALVLQSFAAVVGKQVVAVAVAFGVLRAVHRSFVCESVVQAAILEAQ